MKIHENIIGTIGKTPLVKLSKLGKGLPGNVYVKIESQNPGGSVKDRLALAMITDAEDKGLIHSDTEIIEATSGNTGIGLALICAVKDYKLTIVMPESMSMERRNLLQSFGVNLILTAGSEGMKGAIEKARLLHQANPNSFMPLQFENFSNVEMHRRTTAPEIWEDMDGKIDIFVAGVGTGGTFTGVSSKLKEWNPNLKTVAVEPSSSPVLTKGISGAHKIQGIGAGFIPKIMDVELIDEIISIKDEQAFDIAQRLVKEEGILCGISSGANVFAALQIASRIENKDKNMVTIIADTGERYLSTSLFNHTEHDS